MGIHDEPISGGGQKSTDRLTTFGFVPIEMDTSGDTPRPQFYDNGNTVQIPKEVTETEHVADNWISIGEGIFGSEQADWIPDDAEDGSTYRRFPAWLGFSTTAENLHTQPRMQNLRFNRPTGDGHWKDTPDENDPWIESRWYITDEDTLDYRNQQLGSLETEFVLIGPDPFYETVEENGFDPHNVTVSTDIDFQLSTYTPDDSYAQHLHGGAKVLMDMSTITSAGFAGIGGALGSTGVRAVLNFVTEAGKDLLVNVIVTEIYTALDEYYSGPELSSISEHKLTSAKIAKGFAFVELEDFDSIGLAGPLMTIRA